MNLSSEDLIPCFLQWHDHQHLQSLGIIWPVMLQFLSCTNGVVVIRRWDEFLPLLRPLDKTSPELGLVSTCVVELDLFVGIPYLWQPSLKLAILLHDAVIILTG